MGNLCFFFPQWWCHPHFISLEINMCIPPSFFPIPEHFLHEVWLKIAVGNISSSYLQSHCFSVGGKSRKLVVRAKEQMIQRDQGCTLILACSLLPLERKLQGRSKPPALLEIINWSVEQEVNSLSPRLNPEIVTKNNYNRPCAKRVSLGRK